MRIVPPKNGKYVSPKKISKLISIFEKVYVTERYTRINVKVLNQKSFIIVKKFELDGILFLENCDLFRYQDLFHFLTF